MNNYMYVYCTLKDKGLVFGDAYVHDDTCKNNMAETETELTLCDEIKY